MPKSILVSLFTLFALETTYAAPQLPSYYPKSFQQQLNSGLKDDSLKEELFFVLSKAHIVSPDGDTLVENCLNKNDCVEHTSLGYNGARRVMFGRIFLEQDAKGYFVPDLYCQKNYYASDFRKDPPGPDQIPDHEVLNTEHSWPQSKFSHKFPKEMQKSDLNILFPVSKEANSTRSNLPLGDVQNVESSPCPLAKRGSTQEDDGTYFEPPEQQKGASARAILYFSVRYKMRIESTEENYLRTWNKRYPPDSIERSRNEQVYEAQGNRNPFIDAPELADLISDF